MRKKSTIALLSLSMLLFGAVAVSADEHGQSEPHPQSKASAPARAPAPVGRPAPVYANGQALDARYNHGRYYPSVGTVRPALPAEYRPYYYRGAPYYFSGGVWYAPRGPGFVVVGPPVGLIIATLPPYYATVWIGGVPYYYANNVYYNWQPDQNGYAVVDPPADADAPSPPPGSGQIPPDGGQMDLIIYPKNGQSKEQQAADQFECHNWAKGQTGFDPTQAGGGPGNSDVNRSNYNRAMSACLQARGYQVN
ncbi:MAG: DUF6515 family protein [Steroidobacteraceae bacterium]